MNEKSGVGNVHSSGRMISLNTIICKKCIFGARKIGICNQIMLITSNKLSKKNTKKMDNYKKFHGLAFFSNACTTQAWWCVHCTISVIFFSVFFFGLHCIINRRTYINIEKKKQPKIKTIIDKMCATYLGFSLTSNRIQLISFRAQIEYMYEKK